MEDCDATASAKIKSYKPQRIYTSSLTNAVYVDGSWIWAGRRQGMYTLMYEYSLISAISSQASSYLLVTDAAS